MEEPIDFAVVTQKDENIAKGTEKVITEGQEGLSFKRNMKLQKKMGKKFLELLID